MPRRRDRRPVRGWPSTRSPTGWPTGTPDRSTATLGAALTELADIGYQAVKADVPTDMPAEHYLSWLRRLRPEPVVEPVLRIVRRPGHPRSDGRAGSAFRRDPGRVRPVRVHDLHHRGARKRPDGPPGGRHRLRPGQAPGRRRRDRRGAAGPCRPRVCRRPCTRTSGAGSRPSRRSAACSTTSTPTCSPSAPTPATCPGPEWMSPQCCPTTRTRIVGVHLKDTFAAGIAARQVRGPGLPHRDRSRPDLGRTRHRASRAGSVYRGLSRVVRR